MNPVVITVNCPTESEAVGIAREAVRRRLAAAGSTYPVTSVYWWNGMMSNRREFAVVLKTVESHAEAVADVISAMHSYDTPSVMTTPVTGTGPGVMDWLDASVGDRDAPEQGSTLA